MMDDKLQPCLVPWCNGEVLEVLRNPFSHNHYVKCQNCGVTGPAALFESDAISAWNVWPRPKIGIQETSQ